MSTVQRLLRGSLFRTTELVVMLGATFFVTPMLVHSLGSRLFGFWTLASAFVGYYGLLDFGLTSASARYLSQALGREDARELDKVGSTALFLFLVVAAVLAAATLAAAMACPLFLHDAAEAAMFQKLILIVGLATAVGFPGKVYISLLTADIRHDVVAMISIARTVSYAALLYVCLRAGGGIIAVAVVFSTASLLQSGAVCLAALSRFPNARLAPAGRDRAAVGSMFRYGRTTFLCQMGDLLRFRMDSLVIASFLNASLVTPYAIGVRLVDGFGQLVLGCVGMTTPVFSRLEGRGDYAAIRGALLKMTKLSAILSAYTGLSVIFYAPAFIARWMGPGWDSAVNVTTILCLGYIVSLPHSPGVQLLYGLSKHRIYAGLSIGEGLLNLALSLLLLRFYGLYGVALGTTAAMVVFKFTVQPYFVCREAALPLRTYLVDTILLTLLKTAAPLALYFRLIRGFVAADYLALGACVAVQTALFAPFAYLFILNADERRVVAGAVQRPVAA